LYVGSSRIPLCLTASSWCFLSVLLSSLCGRTESLLFLPLSRYQLKPCEYLRELGLSPSGLSVLLPTHQQFSNRRSESAASCWTIRDLWPLTICHLILWSQLQQQLLEYLQWLMPLTVRHPDHFHIFYPNDSLVPSSVCRGMVWRNNGKVLCTMKRSDSTTEPLALFPSWSPHAPSILWLTSYIFSPETLVW
jgi:hypothetical protein